MIRSLSICLLCVLPKLSYHYKYLSDFYNVIYEDAVVGRIEEVESVFWLYM